MPQIIFNSRIKSLPFPSFIIDFNDKDKQYITWQNLFDTIHNKYGINKNILRLFDHNNKSIDYINIEKIEKLNITNFIITYMFSGKSSNDYWVSFDLFAKPRQKLK